jgi:four helix bundle protein
VARVLPVCSGVGAKTYRELVVFQRAAELRRVLALLSTPAAREDRRFSDQLRDAVRSPPRNIAEGFGRYNPAEFAQFMDIAISSLDEVDTHLRDGVESGLFSPESAAEAIRLCASCRWMAVRLRTYLRSQAARRRKKRP